TATTRRTATNTPTSYTKPPLAPPKPWTSSNPGPLPVSVTSRATPSSMVIRMSSPSRAVPPLSPDVAKTAQEALVGYVDGRDRHRGIVTPPVIRPMAACHRDRGPARGAGHEGPPR